MKRIALFSHACVVETNRELYNEIKKEFNLLLICPREWKGSLIRDLKTKSSNGIVSYPVWNSGNGSLFFYRSRFQEVKNFAPDLIFCDEEPWSLCALQIYLSFPKVKKIFYTKQNLRKKLPLPFHFIQKYIFQKSEEACVISKEASDVLRWKKFKKEIQILPHSFNQHKFRPMEKNEKDLIRRRFDLPLEKTTIGYFGRLTEEKGVQDILSATKILLQDTKIGNLSFVLVGNGPLRESAEKLSAEYPGQIFCFPAIPHEHVHTLMAAMDLTLLPSHTTAAWKEQFGRVVIESAACGVPVIGSDSGEIPHLINRVNCGTSFAEGDVQALAKAILKLSLEKSLLENIAKKAEKNARDFYCHESVGNFLNNYLLSLCR